MPIKSQAAPAAHRGGARTPTPARSRATRAPSWSAGCSSTRSTRPPARSWGGTTSSTGTSSPGGCARGRARPAGGAGGARRGLGLQAHRGARPGARQRRARARHEVLADRLSITDAISRVAEVLRLRRRVSFVELLARRRERGRAPASSRPSSRSSRWRSCGSSASSRRRRTRTGPGAEILVEARDTLGEGGAGTPEGLEEYR